MTDLQPAAEIMLPLTGELVSLAEPVQVCRALDQVRELKRQLDHVRAVLEDALRLESERQGTKTLHLGELTAVVSGGEKVEYDFQELAYELLRLGLPEQRVGELIIQTVTYRVDQRVAKQLAGANPRYADAIERHSRAVPDRWRVTVKKTPLHQQTDAQLRAGVNEFTQDDPPPYK